MNWYEQVMNRTEWFREARVGMFIHFGLYAIPARGEWVRSMERSSVEEYHRYFDEFNPAELDMDEWMRVAAKAGARYVVLTAKHHDGFCLYDSALTDYKVTNTPYGRDIIEEYVGAARRHGLRVGIYYSLVDWYHEGYPVWQDRQHPLRDDPAWKGVDHDFDAYLDFMHGQVRELCTNYGQVDVLWFDFSYWEMKGEAWRATELVSMVRSLQPDVLIDNRLGGSMWAREPEPYAGDFAGPEQMIPRRPVRNFHGRPLPWESCITLNDSWGYCATDHNWKDPSFVIRALVNCVSKGGNLLINVGPDARGRIPEPSLRILSEVGSWLTTNGASIYGCGDAELPQPEWGFYTRRGTELYAHLLHPTVGHYCLPALRGRVSEARLLADGSEAFLGPYWNSDAGAEVFGDKDDVYMNVGKPMMRTFQLPDSRDTVVRLRLAEERRQ
ncbi:MAG: alpha-L-fucosidase [Spirochaetota bacterium]